MSAKPWFQAPSRTSGSGSDTNNARLGSGTVCRFQPGKWLGLGVLLGGCTLDPQPIPLPSYVDAEEQDSAADAPVVALDEARDDGNQPEPTSSEPLNGQENNGAGSQAPPSVDNADEVDSGGQADAGVDAGAPSPDASSAADAG